MYDTLINFFNERIELDSDEQAFLQKNTVLRAVQRNEVLLKQGHVSREFFFVVSGCVRLYYESGLEEKTAFFYTENMFVSSYQSFTKQIPAKHNLVALEDSRLIVFDFESTLRFLEYSPKFDALARIVLEDELAIYQDIIASFVTQNAEERYLYLLNNNPMLFERIPQHQIATYLGVSPETLSRIRRRIIKK